MNSPPPPLLIKAAVCREFGAPLSLEELQLLPPRENEVRIKLSACAICHSDIIYLDGGWGGTPPIVFGHEAAGIVAEVGANVRNVKVGDHVLATLLRSCGQCHSCARGMSYQCLGEFEIDINPHLRDAKGAKVFAGLRTGAFAEQVVINSSQAISIPKDIKFDAASLLSCSVITGAGAVINTARVQAGDSVAIVGCGGVGLNCVQGGALSGANPVCAVDLIDKKLSDAESFGATHIINFAKEDAKKNALELTEGRGFDYVFMAAGTSKAIEFALNLTARGGALVLVGMPADGDYPQLDAAEIANRSKRILGSKMGSARLQRDIPKLIRLYQEGRLKLDELIANRYSLAQINQAIADARRGESLRNVVVFDC